jgi:hypothetical protein
VLPVVAPRPVVTIGNKLGSWLTSAGIHSPHAGELWNAYSSLSDGQTRQAFLRTLRSVVDYRGQEVSVINKLHVSSGLPTLLIWGDQDRIIPATNRCTVLLASDCRPRTFQPRVFRSPQQKLIDHVRTPISCSPPRRPDLSEIVPGNRGRRTRHAYADIWLSRNDHHGDRGVTQDFRGGRAEEHLSRRSGRA